MKQKKQYFEPAVDVTLFSEDVLMASGTAPDDAGIQWDSEWNRNDF